MPEKPEFTGSSNDNNLPSEFKEFLDKENNINRARIMVDAMIEENPNLTIEEALKKALEVLENPIISSSEICHNKDDE